MKRALRQQTLQAMRTLPLNLRKKWQENLFKRCVDYCICQGIRKVGLYYGINPEIETAQLIEQLTQAKVEVYLPRIQTHQQLTFHLYEGEESLEVVQKWIRQPKKIAKQIKLEELELIIVPGVVFSYQGDRIGFGGGYYDRLLPRVSCETISLVFPIQVKSAHYWKSEEHDCRVQQVWIAD